MKLCTSHFFFSPPSTLCFANQFWVCLHRRSSSSSPMSPSHAADPSRPVLYLTAHPTPTSLVLHLSTDPSSIADLSFIVDPSSTDTAFIELKSAMDFVAVARFRGFRDGGLAGFHGDWVSWVSGGVLCWWWFVWWFLANLDFWQWLWVVVLGLLVVGGWL